MISLGIKKQDLSAGFNLTRLLGPTLTLSLVILTSFFCTTSTGAHQSPSLSAMYGRGVHAYFAGNSSLAEQLFTQVIQSGSQDPRAYYFRAVLRMRMGRQHEAENDMRIGANFEAQSPGAQHSIGRSLQRVQGTHRRILEKFRRQARIDRVQQNQHQSQQRYEYLDRRAPAVLRQSPPLTLTQPLQAPSVPKNTAPPVAAPAQPPIVPAENRPPVENVTPPPVMVEATPNLNTPNTENAPVVDPFGTEETLAEPTESPEVSDPFENELPSPAVESGDPLGDDSMSAESILDSKPTIDPTPEETAEDPFGDDVIEEADPFSESTTPAEQPTEMNDPLSDQNSSGTEEADPFGDEFIPEEEPTAELEEELDPFGDSANESMPTEQPVDDANPFGADATTAQPTATNPVPLPSMGNPAAASPANGLFFALGKWLGSTSNSSSAISPKFSGLGSDEELPADNFQFGPASETDDPTANLPADDEGLAETMPPQPPLESNQMELPAEEGADAAGSDPFGEEESDPFGEAEPVEEDDPFGEEESNADNPFGE